MAQGIQRRCAVPAAHVEFGVSELVEGARPFGPDQALVVLGVDDEDPGRGHGDHGDGGRRPGDTPVVEHDDTLSPDHLEGAPEAAPTIAPGPPDLGAGRWGHVIPRAGQPVATGTGGATLIRLAGGGCMVGHRPMVGEP